jgi:beta-galactosidase
MVRIASLSGLFAAFLIACGSSEPAASSSGAPSPETLAFPKTFLFGAAIAGFQVDMGCPTLPASVCDDPNSDWYAWVTSPKTVMDPKTYIAGDPLSAGPGHWELYEKDFDLAKNDLHLRGVRMSFEWSRIFPTKTDDAEGYDALKKIANAAAVQHYHDVLKALHARGLTPLVTLNHYTLPTWIHDGVGCHFDIATCSPRGWLDKDRTVKEIAKYAGFVAKEFGGEVDLWATENEPFAVMLPGYLLPSANRTNPPGLLLHSKEAKSVIGALIYAHARMYDAIKANDGVDADGDGKSSFVGLVYSMVPFKPKDPMNDLDVQAQKNLFYLYNMAFLNAVAKGDLDQDLTGNAVHQDDLANRMDYLGLNYYTRATVEGFNEAFLPQLSPLSTFNPLSLSFGEDYPHGIYEMLEIVNKDLGVPAIITENGAADPDDDETGPSFLVRHLTWLSRAIRDGHDVRGYFYWTLMDNYEWNHGMSIRMGLYAVDKNDKMKTRTARKTARTYTSIIDASAVPPDLASRYPAP